ncbi:MAG: Gfo/Idh/MocA family oxidoreductase [Clostridia bacterium]|nr:Gfo/Idh/MocA family oxidoreductase [Clostridia bacterium]
MIRLLRIGIVDQYLDNWHCSHFPFYMRETIAGLGYDAQITGAFAVQERPPEGGQCTKDWCRERDIPEASSMEELIADSDAIMVIAADDARCHEELCRLPLRSGKPVFVDKTFAPDAQAGLRMFDLARRYGTPVFSSSAQRYCQSILDWQASHPARPRFVSTVGPHSLDRYAVHQLEVIVALMGPDIRRVKAFSCGDMVTQLILDYGGGRWASFMQTPQPYAEFNFMVSPDGETGARLASDDGNFYHNLMKAILTFFMTGLSPVPEKETMAILSVIDKARIARNDPDVWYPL